MLTIKPKKVKVTVKGTLNKAKKSDSIDDWKVPSKRAINEPLPESYVNEIIEVYNKGKKVGQQNALKDLKKQISSHIQKNTNQAKKFGELFFHSINEEMNIKCSKVYIRTESISDFRLLFLIDPKNYLSEDFKAVYEKSIKERKKINSDSFHITVMFIPEIETLDKKKIVSDGYTHFYNGEAKK